MHKEFESNFDQLQQSVKAHLIIDRPTEYIGLSTVESFKPFIVGETFSRLHPHQAKNGQFHKGKMIIIETNVIGNKAIAKCVLPNCQEMILLEVKYSN